MKKLSVYTILISAITLAFSLNGCNKENPFTSDDFQKGSVLKIDAEPCELNCLLNATHDLSENEVAMLLQMREEEKMARDVYDALSGLYTLQVFEKISASESVHMDRVLCLLIHFEIDDPASSVVGEFTNPVIQNLYYELVEQGEISLLKALEVGASIEDLDIFDLSYFLGETENEAITSVFENLMCGSGNHMRSFYNLLATRGVEYSPEHITQGELNAILEDEHQECTMD